MDMFNSIYQNFIKLPILKRRLIVAFCFTTLSIVMSFPSQVFWMNGEYALSIAVVGWMVLVTWLSPGLINRRRQKLHGPEVVITPGEDTSSCRGLILCGGGGKGAYQLGALRAFEEERIKFDVISGASVGALNAALYISRGLSSTRSIFVSEISNVLRFRWHTLIVVIARFYAYSARYVIAEPKMQVKRAAGLLLASIGLLLLLPSEEIFVPNEGAWVVFTTSTYFGLTFSPFLLSACLWLASEHWNWSAFPALALKNLIETNIEPGSLVGSDVRLFVTAAKDTNKLIPPYLSEWPEKLYVPEYKEIDANSREIQSWLLASASIPFGVLPSVKIGSTTFVDGGISDNAPILPALEAGCREIYIVHTNAQGTANGEELTKHEGLLAHISRCLLLRQLGAEMSGNATENSPRDYKAEFSSRIIHICPSKPTGSLVGSLLFNVKTNAEKLEKLGYDDTKKILQFSRNDQNSNGKG